jgi:hypothetical protein
MNNGVECEKMGSQEWYESWARWYMLVIPALGRLRQEDGKFQATATPCFKKRRS